jgi:hypothetical protein
MNELFWKFKFWFRLEWWSDMNNHESLEKKFCRLNVKTAGTWTWFDLVMPAIDDNPDISE